MDPPIPPQTTTTTPTAGSNDNGSKDPTTILKGKRTKRQRPTFTTHSSTSNNPIISSPASYSNSHSPATAEDEDTANCLILLSKGHNISPRNNNIIQEPTHKFNSKKYIQTSTHSTNGLTGIYVYECKTCSRTFPSFQALGGHRASHKKPKANEFNKPHSEEDELSPPELLSSSLQLKDHRSCSPEKIKKLPSNKLHECSICGAEFTSGQALGGHMRRHRAANVNGSVATNTTLSLIPYSSVTVADDDDKLKSIRNDGLCLGLDLNLPAPETAVVVLGQEERWESGFKFPANQSKQQPSVRLSAGPTLVDCYY